ncbi:hypothetical protein RUND412_007224 [Rhizina undulata]
MSDSHKHIYDNYLQPPSTSLGATGRRGFFMDRNHNDARIENSALMVHREQQSTILRRANIFVACSQPAGTSVPEIAQAVAKTSTPKNTRNMLPLMSGSATERSFLRN